jgi:hypothetical protein
MVVMKRCLLFLLFYLFLSFSSSATYKSTSDQKEEMEQAFHKYEMRGPTYFGQSEDKTNTDPISLAPTWRAVRDTLPDRTESVVSVEGNFYDLHEGKQEEAAQIYHLFNEFLHFLTTTRFVYLSQLKEDAQAFNKILALNTGSGITFRPFTMYSNRLSDQAMGALGLRALQYWIDITQLMKKILFPGELISVYAPQKSELIRAILASSPIPSAKVIEEQRAVLGNDIDPISHMYFEFSEALISFAERFDTMVSPVNYSLIDPKMMTKVESWRLQHEERERRKSVAIINSVKKLHIYYLRSMATTLTILRDRGLHHSLEMLAKIGGRQEPIISSLRPLVEAFDGKWDLMFEKNVEGFLLDLKTQCFELEEVRRDLQLLGPAFCGYDLFAELSEAWEYERGILAHLDATMAKTPTPVPEPAMVAAEQIAPEPKADVDYEKYFQEINAHYKEKKRSSSAIEEPVVKELTPYQVELYTFLLDRIYRPKVKQTWEEIVSALKDLGFVGAPNRLGNGSTWVFRVSNKNEMFFADATKSQTTFNVHQFKGNENINRRYLYYFQSAFSCLFGLSEEHVTAELKR